MIKQRNLWLAPLLCMAAIAPFTPFLDLTISRYFYHPETRSFPSHPLFDFLYIDGVLPAQVIGFSAALFFLLSYFSPFWKSWRKELILLTLSLALGAGLIVHTILKDNWGRPRPKQTVEFGGKQAFRPFYLPNVFHQPEPSKSFPCGHCSMGFYFFAVAVIGIYRRNRLIFYMGMIPALVFGLLLGLARIAQGGHFFSDVLVSALIMWLVPLFIGKLLYKSEEKKDERYRAN